MAIELFLDQDGEISGPYSPSDLRRMVNDGEVRREDLIRKGMDGKPVQAENIKGLFPTELATVKTTPIKPAKQTQRTSEPEPEPNSPTEILSKTWGFVTASVSKLRPQQITATPVESNVISPVAPRFNPPLQSITPVATDVSACPFCGEEIKAIAKKCKHCGEILDVVMRANSQPQLQPQIYAHAPPVINIVNTNNSHASVNGNGRGSARWSPLFAALLSFIFPGLGQLYKGQPINAVVWFFIVICGYVALVVPGLVLHLCCVIGAASGDPYR